jgi:AcrR family transcriptional regulator
MPMQRRMPAEDRKAEIVAALLDLADRIGPDRLTTTDIAREVGVTQAAIFRHFPTKAELWSTAGEVIAGRLEAAWQESIAGSACATDRLRALVAAQLRQIERCPALPVILHSRELNVENATLRERFRGLLAQYQGHLAACLEAMSAEGAIAGVAPADAALLVVSLVQGTAIRWSLGARRFALEAEGLRLLDVQLALFADRERPR